MNGGKVHRAFLGVVIQPVTQPLAEQFKVNVNQGVLVTEVGPIHPPRSGLKPGDIILKFAGQPVTSPRELQENVEMQKAGSSEPLLLLRNGKQTTLNVVCREMPANFATAKTEPLAIGGGSSHFGKLGLEVENLSPKVAQQLGVKADHGVAITDVQSGSPADMAGLTTGMVITEVNRQAVNNSEDFHKALASKSLDQGVLLLVRTAEGSRFVVIRVES